MFCPGMIDAQRLLSQIITRILISACPAPAADPPVFTPAAFAVQFIGVSKLQEKGGLGPDPAQALLADISGNDR
jgi:hypothetical protein